MNDPSGLVFVASGRCVQGLDRASGQPVWQRKLPSSFFSSGFATIMVDGREVFVGRDGYVYCLDAASGTVIWERGVKSGGSLVVMASADGRQGSGAAVGAAASAAAAAASAAS